MRERPGRDFPIETRKQVKAEQEHRCALCGQAGHLEIHHIQPKSMGGSNGRDNAVGLCAPCHDLCDWLTITGKVPFQRIMEVGREYVLPFYEER